MRTEKVIARYYCGGKPKEYRITCYREFEKAQNQKGIAEIIYWRLYGRYIRPFEFDDPIFRQGYKNGFAMMASCCLLIETYIGFKKESTLLLNKAKTDFNSSKHFAYFFTEEPEFNLLNDVSQNANGDWILGKNKPGLINDFYNNVRCGILHYGETRNGWTINRNNDDKYVDLENKNINAYSFMSRLKNVIEQYTNSLADDTDWNSTPWKIARSKMDDIIKNCFEIDSM